MLVDSVSSGLPGFAFIHTKIRDYYHRQIKKRQAMIWLPSAVTTVVVLLLAGYLNPFLHEYIHWAAGKVFSGGPKVLYSSKFGVPSPWGVEYRNLEQMSNTEVRIAGILPHFLGIGGFVGLIGIAINPPALSLTSPIESTVVAVQFINTMPLSRLFALTILFAAGISVSPSDLVAACFPREYRRYRGQEFSHPEWAEVFVKNLR
ncbi:hypothetical protein EGH22_16380 [Halomicroarcula sp. F28]|uniref:hypothetical protein n=1 Tax=Haloarcula salinisoli TaxID=2487746 RepID=UPI001C730A52|nr:hypothetical protein [Halomicroarcula salinisoli]MBX0287912.1 hypothetical protein [Halomicroarcula salinisoli]